ncbi:hypothetical protein EYF80_033276 [Liparis tanakae]|uniref:Uncharacterized protein n=1 Tax=Liparis tanakae TaxID=230148 RepID=A0A4Z2GTH1_9TELE|nr:hypothetical protein EYF80_033276 [Liparis tanakae]
MKRSDESAPAPGSRLDLRTPMTSWRRAWATRAPPPQRHAERCRASLFLPVPRIIKKKWSVFRIRGARRLQWRHQEVWIR